VQEATEAVQMAPGSGCEAKVSRREVLFKKLAQRSRYLSEVDVNFKEGSCDESFGKP